MSIADPAVPREIKDIALAEGGKRRIEWAFQSMPVLANIRKEFIRTQAFSGLRLAALLPLTAAAANLVITLRDAGAAIMLAGSVGFPVEDDVAACLVKDYQVPVFATSDSAESQPGWMEKVLRHEPQILIDELGDLALPIAEQAPKPDLIGAVVGTREAARQLRLLARDGRLHFPVLSAYSSLSRRIFHSGMGLGQSALNAAIRSMDLLLAGLTVVVIGFGTTGRAIASRARGMGSVVTVTEVDPVRALEAAMEGFRVLALADASSIGDLFFATSGGRNVIGREHFDKLRNGAILVAAGESDVEIDLNTLDHIAGGRRTLPAGVDEIALRDGRRIYLVAGGRSVQSTQEAAYPASMVDLGFANRALSAEYLVKNRSSSLRAEVYGIPSEIDRRVARLKLESTGIKIDRLTVEQEQYLAQASE